MLLSKFLIDIENYFHALNEFIIVYTVKNVIKRSMKFINEFDKKNSEIGSRYTVLTTVFRRPFLIYTVKKSD